MLLTLIFNGSQLRDLKSAADDFSKFIDHDDYTINDAVFNAVEEL